MATGMIKNNFVSTDPTITFNSNVTDNGTKIFRMNNLIFINFNFIVTNGVAQSWLTVGNVTPLPENGVIMEYATTTPSITIGVWVKESGEIVCFNNGNGSFNNAIRGLLVYTI